MMNHDRPANRLYMLALPLVLAGSLWIHHRTWAAEPAKTVTPAVFDYADEVSRLVEGQKIDQLAKLTIPDTSRETARLQGWTAEYVAHLQSAEAERKKEYDDAVKKAT